MVIANLIRIQHWLIGFDKLIKVPPISINGGIYKFKPFWFSCCNKQQSMLLISGSSKYKYGANVMPTRSEHVTLEYRLEAGLDRRHIICVNRCWLGTQSSDAVLLSFLFLLQAHSEMLCECYWLIWTWSIYQISSILITMIILNI